VGRGAGPAPELSHWISAVVPPLILRTCSGCSYHG
jgi:hypothetical protein